jgi:hypothetical protein
MIRVFHPVSGSLVRILIFLPIPDPGVIKAPDPGSGSATLLLPIRGVLSKLSINIIDFAGGGVQRAELQDDSHGELIQERRYVLYLLYHLSILPPNESIPFPAGTALQPMRRCRYLFHTANQRTCYSSLHTI